VNENTNAKTVPATVTLPGIGTAELRYSHRNLRVLEDAAGVPIGELVGGTPSVGSMDAILYAGCWERLQQKGGMSFAEFRETVLDDMSGKAYMAATQKAMLALNEAFEDEDAPEAENGGDAEKN